MTTARHLHVVRTNYATVQPCAFCGRLRSTRDLKPLDGRDRKQVCASDIVRCVNRGWKT